MAYPKSHETSHSLQHSEPAIRDFPNEVNRVKTLHVDDSMRDEHVIYRTDLVEMTNGIRYLATYNTVESAKEAAKDPANKRFAGSNIVTLEGTAWVTKNGKFYRDRHDVQARDHLRPSMIVGVQQNLNRFNNLYKTTDDMLAIHAFYAALMDYDQEVLTTMGTSRGGMLALLLQLRAERYGKKVAHSDSMVPCIPTPLDTLKMLAPNNLMNMIVNEKEASKNLGHAWEELLQMKDTLDVLTFRGIVQQLKEGLALAGSNISSAVEKTDHNDHVGDIIVQEGDGMSFATKWPVIFKNQPHMNVDVRPGGGHASSVSKTYFYDAMNRQEAVAKTLHAHPDNRRLGGQALRSLIDQHNSRHQTAV